jgi:hypothetical protein
MEVALYASNGIDNRICSSVEQDRCMIGPNVAIPWSWLVP